MPRITAGKAKGVSLKVLEGTTRPITDRVKISIFDTISPVIEGADVLDLFAGSGSIGLEAVSRGANSALLVERNEKAVKLIQENIAKTKFQDQVEVTNQDVKSYLSTSDEAFDIIFLDPPFKFERDVKVKYLKQSLKHLRINGLAVFRFPKGEKFPTEIGNFSLTLRKEYGKSVVYYYQATEE